MNTVLPIDKNGEILNILTTQYIKSACPVSSAQIALHLNYEISSSSIRNILYQLEELDYVKKPHTSSGRIPTKKGYRYYVDGIIESENEHLLDSVHIPADETRLLQRKIAQNIHLVSGIVGSNCDINPDGFKYLFNEPEFKEQEMIIDFSKLLSKLSNIAAAEKAFSHYKGFKLFIGNEANGYGFDNLTVATCYIDDGRIFFSAGSMRMDYEKLINYFIYL